MTGQCDLFDTAPRDYFVSLVRGGRVSLLAGPFPTHAAATEVRQRAWDEAERIDPRAWFDACGTCSLPAPSGRVGVLNGRLGLQDAK